jgi:hypothetical protein
VSELVSGVESFSDDTVVAVSMHIALLELLVLFVGVLAVDAAVTMLGGNSTRVAILTFAAVVLGAIIMVLTATIFALSMFLCHFFL